MEYAYYGQVKVRFADTDANGHAYFGSYVVFADEVGSEYWVDLGWGFQTQEEQPALTFMVNSNIDYLSECLYGDWLDVGVRFSRLGNKSITMSFEMTNRRSGEVAARGDFVSAFVDKETRKSCPVPETFRAAVLARQPELAG